MEKQNYKKTFNGEAFSNGVDLYSHFESDKSMYLFKNDEMICKIKSSMIIPVISLNEKNNYYIRSLNNEPIVFTCICYILDSQLLKDIWGNYNFKNQYYHIDNGEIFKTKQISKY